MTIFHWKFGAKLQNMSLYFRTENTVVRKPKINHCTHKKRRQNSIINKQTKKNALAQMKEQIEWCLIEENIFYKNSFFGTFI